MVKIVGAGPGAKDLITVRGMRMLNEADVIIYAGSLVNEELLEYAKKDCEIYNSAYMNLREVIDVEFEEVERLEDAMSQLDVLYMTRVQRERFFNEEDYIRLKDFYILTKEKMELAKDDMIVLHPLPRVNEISVEVDDDPRAAYFTQVQNGVYVRMALILTLLGIEVE